MSITTASFGKLPSGREVNLYTMTNAGGASVSITDFGGIIVKVIVPDKDGKLDDVVLGYSCAAHYDPNPGYIGALIGRYANRIGHGAFSFKGQPMQLNCNSNGHHLHGGNEGFDRKIWTAQMRELNGVDELKLTIVSPDGEENYPGTLKVCVTYSFNDKNELSIHYEAVSDQDTIVNLTNHAYFNLEGEGSGTVANHIMQINADKFTVVDCDSIPTGELRDVTGTPFDLRAGKVLAEGFAVQADDEQLTFGQGYDHNFVVNGQGMRCAAVLTAPVSGRVMTVYTDKPGIQLYTGNMIDCIEKGKCGRMYQKRDALCLETQFFPDSVNHSDFPSPMLKEGEKYDFTTVYAFSVK
jgi:aldose 1-epimerase